MRAPFQPEIKDEVRRERERESEREAERKTKYFIRGVRELGRICFENYRRDIITTICLPKKSG